MRTGRASVLVNLRHVVLRHVGQLYGPAGSFGGVLLQAATGPILQAARSFRRPFSIAGTAHLVALLLLFLIVP
jgi:hypothetical protein